MLNFVRALAYIISFWCYYKVNVSPNESHEMGYVEGDKPYPGGKSNYFGRGPSTIRALLVLLLVPFASCQLIYYKSLSDLEIFFFMGIILCYQLRIESYRALGHMFTFILGVRKDHTLVETGPYKILIHPSYTGQLGVLYIMWIWMFVYSQVLIGYVIFAFLFIYTTHKLIFRMNLEEKMMEEHFENYSTYKSTRYRLIPFVY